MTILFSFAFKTEIFFKKFSEFLFLFNYIQKKSEEAFLKSQKRVSFPLCHEVVATESSSTCFTPDALPDTTPKGIFGTDKTKMNIMSIKYIYSVKNQFNWSEPV